MTEPVYRLITNIFNQVRELPPSEQASVLELLCKGDSDLLAKVVALLEADRHASGSGFLERTGFEDAASSLVLSSVKLPAAGTILGKYQLGGQIAAGGMGVVYEAEDLALNRRVAVKVLAPGFAEQLERRLERFEREARAAAQLTHPHIATIYEAAIDNGCAYIGMELVEGETLRALIAQRRLPDAATLLDIIGQAASALEAAHKAGIVHRDIKPENLMMRPDGFIKVLDFGLASVSEQRQDTRSALTRHGQVPGTIQYLSPEQALGRAVDGRSDLFSLGVVAYELATGVQPFHGPTDAAVFDAILHYIPQPPSELRPELGKAIDSVVLPLLAKDCESRIQTAGEFRSMCLALTRVPTPSAGIARPVLQPDRKDKQSRRRMSRASAAMLAACVFACIAAAAIWIKSQAAPRFRVTRTVQITRSDAPVDRFVLDGPRIFYAAGPQDSRIRMFAVNATGGEPVPLPKLDGMVPLDISRDHSQILLAQYTTSVSAESFPLWVASTSSLLMGAGEEPRRVAGLAGRFARWSPKGDLIAFSDNDRLKVAHSDGSQPREIARLNSFISENGAWSPDGRFVRLTAVRPNSRRIWEVAVDGSGLSELFPNWNVRWQEMGAWLPESRLFVFSGGDNARDLWVIRDRGKSSLSRPGTPQALTNGPLWAYEPEPAADERRIYFRGQSNLGQLVVLDKQTNQWKPFLNGIDALQLDYSKDGRLITYTDSNGSVWRARSDGSQRRQLTVPPLFARNPRWSPDGQTIVFFGAEIGHAESVYLVPAEGGAVSRLIDPALGTSDPTWSPDGAYILFAAYPPGGVWHLVRWEVRTHHSEELPNSAGLWSPRYSPDGRSAVALDQAFHLHLYDVTRYRDRQLTDLVAGYPTWSRDGESIYFENSSSDAWYRVSLSDRKVQIAASLEGLVTTVNSKGWVGMTPDGRIISARAVNVSNIYALDWELD